MNKTKSQNMYHHYEGRDCVARFPIHSDGGGVWITGPILLTDELENPADPNSKRKWDHSKENDLVVSRQPENPKLAPAEARAVNILRRKLGTPPPGVSAGEGWGTLEVENRSKGMSLKEMAAKGFLGDA